MSKRIFLAGASGAIGRRLCRLLVEDGWIVTGTTRSREKATVLLELGIEPAIGDVFDAAWLRATVGNARPDVLIHQLTDLPPALDPTRMAAALVRNDRIRDTGTRNLVAAALDAGVFRMIAQSVAFAYAPGPRPYREDAPLDIDAVGSAGATARGIASLEHQVLHAPLDGVILRYGKIYGPGTGFDHALPPGAVHVDAAADAARRAVTRGASGIYNVAEDDGMVSSLEAVAKLGWSPDFRIG